MHVTPHPHPHTHYHLCRCDSWCVTATCRSLEQGDTTEQGCVLGHLCAHASSRPHEEKAHAKTEFLSNTKKLPRIHLSTTYWKFSVFFMNISLIPPFSSTFGSYRSHIKFSNSLLALTHEFIGCAATSQLCENMITSPHGDHRLNRL